MDNFVHLHVHSEYSLLDGLAKISDLIEKAVKFHMPALAITDHGAMYGAFKFYREAKKAGIKPILGVEAYQAKRSRFDKQSGIDNDRYHLTLLSKNLTGYKNLMKLTTAANLEGFYYKPRIDWEILKKYSEGVIALSGCLEGLISSNIREGKEKEAEKELQKYLDIFKEDFYLELQKHQNNEELEKVNKKLIEFSRKHGVPVVATNDVHYVNAEDAYAQEILLCIQTQRTILEKNRPMSMISSPDFYFKSPDEMRGLFLDCEEAITNTLKIAEKCDVELETHKWILPHFPLPEKEKPEEYLQKLTYERLPERFPKIDDEIKKRVDYELDIICKKGYATYFLIVSDFVNWAKSQKIAVGPGRGSAAGSVVAYILRITDINPLFHNIPFERFLNPFRPSPPDIDMDFADDRRDEVIKYVTEKYGKDRVAQIITFGTMEARGAVRDAGRALGMPYSQPDRIAKMIPIGALGFAMTLDKALEISPELKTAYQNEEETKKLIDLAKKLEGVARHASTHAAGVVIADKELTEYVPLQYESKGNRIVTQYDIYSLDPNSAPGSQSVGLLKMDFLGLRNLTIIQKALGLIEKTKGQRINLSEIPLNDKTAYELLSSGKTIGIFQLESSGMRRYIKELKPTTIFDLMAMVALYRPGPMQVIPEFIARKHNPALIDYPDIRLKDVLKQSYGLITYQDDVLLTAITLANYSWGDADKLRKAVGKKIPSEIKKQKEKFISGCAQNGISAKKALKIFQLIEPFAGYGFNKAHAAGYALIAYQTAYLKAHFPVEFMTALLAAENEAGSGPAGDEKIKNAVEECRRMNIGIMPPDINKSDVDFTIEDGNIRLGLSAIKNVGSAAIETMVEARKKGPFTTLLDFLKRVELSKVNKKVMESLIKVGAMDLFGNRASLLSGYPNIVAFVNQAKKKKDTGQGMLFAGAEKEDEPEIPALEDFSKNEKLQFEKELLGFYLSEHPLTLKMAKAKTKTTHSIAELSDIETGSKVRIAGSVARIKKVTTKKNNQEMIFATVEDLTGTLDCVVFPTIYARTRNFWYHDNFLLIGGKIDRREERVNLLVDLISPLDL